MLGLGWTEMLVIGVVALIFIGPKDLPVVMGRIGKVMGQIRRMGAEFQREINRSTGLDEVRNLRTSITSPLKQTADEIRKEFNAMTPTGQQQPTGVLKPADPKVESVVSEIHAKAGMTPPAAPVPPAPPKTNDQIAAEAGFKPTKPVAEVQKAPVKTGAVKAAKTPKAAAPAKAAETAEPARKTASRKAAAPKAAPAGAAPAAAAPKPARARAKPAPAAEAAAPVAELKPAKPRSRKKAADSVVEKG